MGTDSMYARCSDALLAPEGVKVRGDVCPWRPVSTICLNNLHREGRVGCQIPSLRSVLFPCGKAPPMFLSQQINFRIILGSSVNDVARIDFTVNLFLHCHTLSLLGEDFCFGPEEAPVSKSGDNGSYDYRNHDFVSKVFEYDTLNIVCVVNTLKHCMRYKHF